MRGHISYVRIPVEHGVRSFGVHNPDQSNPSINISLVVERMTPAIIEELESMTLQGVLVELNLANNSNNNQSKKHVTKRNSKARSINFRG
jgi:hypothetical protein